MSAYSPSSIIERRAVGMPDGHGIELAAPHRFKQFRVRGPRLAAVAEISLEVGTIAVVPPS
jgi:hypothetical protein